MGAGRGRLECRPGLAARHAARARAGSPCGCIDTHDRRAYQRAGGVAWRVGPRARRTRTPGQRRDPLPVRVRSHAPSWWALSTDWPEAARSPRWWWRRTFSLAAGCVSTVLGLLWAYPLLHRLL